MRAAGWSLLGLGALSFAGGALAARTSPHAPTALPALALMGTGAIASAGGVTLLWSAHLASGTPTQPRMLPRGPDLVAGLDPKRGSDLGVRLPVWRFSF